MSLLDQHGIFRPISSLRNNAFLFRGEQNAGIVVRVTSRELLNILKHPQTPTHHFRKWLKQLFREREVDERPVANVIFFLNNFELLKFLQNDRKLFQYNNNDLRTAAKIGRIYTSGRLKPWPNGKCLTTKHHQTTVAHSCHGKTYFSTVRNRE